MRILLSSTLIFSALLSGAQTPSVDHLYKLYNAGAYDIVIEKAIPLVQADEDNADFSLVLGRALADRGRYHDAIPYLDLVIKNDHDDSWRTAWALGYLGTCYFMTGQLDKSRESLLKCYTLDATTNATQYAYKRIVLFGFHDFYRDWKMIESDHFRFYFQKQQGQYTEEYVSTREKAYDGINRFFKSAMVKKLDFFVWDSAEEAQKLLNTELGFADPVFAVVHCHYPQTKGHEMTHVISHYSTNVLNKTGFINEGTAVYFDQSNQDRRQMVTNWIRANNRKVSVKDIWINWGSYPEELSYPLAGLFVEELIHAFGREEYLRFFKDQRYENAKLIFGDRLDKLIADFEEGINND